MNAPGCGVKGHGIANVPGAWYDVGGHVDGALAVLSCALDYTSGLECNWERGNHIASLIAAASELLKLAQQDVEQLEAELKAVEPAGAPEQRRAQQE